MATTITPAALTVTTTETITIGGIAHEFTSSFVKTGVTHISQRQMSIVTGSFTEIVNFSSSLSPGTYLADDTRFVRVTNLDNANQVVMKLNHKASGQTFYRSVGRDSTESFYSLKMNVNTTNAAMSGAVSDTTSVFEVSMSNVGTGYGSPPSVSFSGGGGSSAAGTAVLDGNTVASVTITNPGTGYTSAPTVGFSGGGGSSAAGTAILVADALWTPSDFHNFDSVSAMASGSAVDITVFVATITQ
jgi:hypothetical protein